MVEWEIEGKEYGSCNCPYACPCQFNSLPTHGYCAAMMGVQIDAGHFGGVKLDGLRACAIYQWPGPVHEGNGAMQLIIDKRADAKQRDALIRIMNGQETEDVATMWWVFSAMCSTRYEPVVETIDLEVDIDARRAKLVVPGLIDSTGEPIRNPVTGAEHRVRIDLPNGFEFRLAEIGSARTRTKGKIALELTDTYGQFARIHLSGKGVVDARA